MRGDGEDDDGMETGGELQHHRDDREAAQREREQKALEEAQRERELDERQRRERG